MSHFFSVIICTYNRAKVLPRALDSLLSQSELDWEAVIVDDGSSDNTQRVVERYAASCPKIRFHKRKHNRGVAAARNIGVHLGKGKFVTFLDSDDEFTVDHLAIRKHILDENTDTQMLHGGFRVVGDPFVVDKDDPSKLIHLAECEVGGTFVIDKQVFDRIGGFQDLAYAEDSHFLEVAKSCGVKCRFVAHPSYIYYRDTSNQLTSLHAQSVGAS